MLLTTLANTIPDADVDDVNGDAGDINATDDDGVKIDEDDS